MKSAADGHLADHHFGQTYSQKDGSHQESHKKLGGVRAKVVTGHPKEVGEFHGKGMETGTGRGKMG
jgi:hypothetical protein